MESVDPLISDLIENYGQSHLAGLLADPVTAAAVYSDIHDAEKFRGGIRDYIVRGRALLADARLGKAPFENSVVSVPHGVVLDDLGSDEFMRLEKIGLAEIGKVGFVLVAGGLGERLGFPGIKISLPVETQTNTTYMQLFAESILEFQRLGQRELPLAIMTSEDTHAKTISLLESHEYFGLSKSQVTLMKQGRVPSFADGSGKIAFGQAKPHGHGDVHSLLLQSGLAQQWVQNGFKYLFIFQDTNSLSMRALCACLGVSVEKNFAMNSLTVPRMPGEASGGICTISGADSAPITVSVEYNVLGTLLAAQGAGDVAAEGSEYSPFPGNCNILLFRLEEYVSALVKSNGIVPEFINPKFDPNDSSKMTFKAPARLECLMQDFALLLPSARVGFCSLPRWATFSVVKNSVEEALKKQKSNLPLDCALSGECEFYDSCCRILEIATKRASFEFQGRENQKIISFNGLRHSIGPRVCLKPSFGMTISSIVEKIHGPITLKDGPATSLVLAGPNTHLYGLELSGHLVIGGEGADETGTNKAPLTVINPGWSIEAIDPATPAEPAIAIRGFRIVKEHHFKIAGS